MDEQKLHWVLLYRSEGTNRRSGTMRAAVVGGWLYKHEYEVAHDSLEVRETMVFVPKLDK